MTTGTETVPTGNTFDKYGSTNPVVRRLMSRFGISDDALVPEAYLDLLNREAGPRPAVNPS